MSKLIAIVGGNGSGKTTLAELLCQQAGCTPYLESHADRPFQTLFSQDFHRYALPNQIDYLLTRAEQERQVRAGEAAGVQDGGLDQDFHLYTRLFPHKGFLSDEDFDLCRRTYQTLRGLLPPPDLFIRLDAPLDVLERRLLERNRRLDLEGIVTPADLPLLAAYLDEWLAGVDPARLVSVDAGKDDPAYTQALPGLVLKLGEII